MYGRMNAAFQAACESPSYFSSPYETLTERDFLGDLPDYGWKFPLPSSIPPPEISTANTTAAATTQDQGTEGTVTKAVPGERWLEGQKSEQFQGQNLSTFNPALRMEKLRGIHQIDQKIEALKKYMEDKRAEERKKKEEQGEEAEEEEEEGEEDQQEDNRENGGRGDGSRQSRMHQRQVESDNDDDQNQDQLEEEEDEEGEEDQARYPKHQHQQKGTLTQTPSLHENLSPEEWSMLKQIARDPRSAETLRFQLTPRLCRVLGLKYTAQPQASTFIPSNPQQHTISRTKNHESRVSPRDILSSQQRHSRIVNR